VIPQGSEPVPTRWTRAVGPWRRRIAAVYDSDRFEALRGPRARRVLVVIHAALVVAVAVGVWRQPTVGPGLAGWAAALIAWWFAYMGLLVSVRGITEVHRDLLDEWQLQVRDAAYRLAHRVFAGVAAVAATGFFLGRRDMELAWSHAYGLIWVMVNLLVTLPAVLVALGVVRALD
jgi:hypothetical protein